jgi:hypothetical protein
MEGRLMIEATYIPRKMDGVELYELLRKHRLLPSMLEDPATCIALANSSDVGFLHEGDRVVAVIIETRPSPKALELIWVNEISRLHQKRDFLMEVAQTLRKRWFDELGLQRVGVHIPIARTQTIRTLKTMGFRMETLPWGVRDCMAYGTHLESIAILGLLPSDPVRTVVKTLEISDLPALSKVG